MEAGCYSVRRLELMSRDQWLARRMGGIGASDVPTLFVAYDMVPPGEEVPRWMADKAKMMKSHLGWPRILLEKAGIAEPLKAGSAAAVGSVRERDLLFAWRGQLVSGQWTGDHEPSIVPASIRHADDVPKEWMPLVCRSLSGLQVTPDGWARDVMGGLVNVELKTTIKPSTSCRWYWRLQAASQRIVTGSDWSVVVSGDEWAWAPDKATGLYRNGPVRSWLVDKDEELEQKIRTVVERAVSEINELKKRDKNDWPEHSK